MAEFIIDVGWFSQSATYAKGEVRLMAMIDEGDKTTMRHEVLHLSL
jgi:hypothetical protein